MVNPEDGELMEKRETTKKEIKAQVKSIERLEREEDLVEERSVKATRALIQTLHQTLKSFRL